MIRLLLSTSLLIVTTTAFAKTTMPLHPLSIYTKHKTLALKVQIANTPQTTQHGLMNRHFLPAKQGMLFVFQDSQCLNFWMKNTLIPLDILFINKDHQVVNIQTMQPCRQDPCPIYQSRLPAQYALEVNAGFAKRYQVTPGALISWSNKHP